MKTRSRILAGEGLIFGVLAGTFLGVADMVGAALAHAPAIEVIQRYASVVIGESAFSSTSHDIIFLGVVIHFALSGLFGLLYAVTLTRVPIQSTRSYAREAGFGILFGVALWAVNYHLVARLLYPWLLGPSLPMQLAIHALFYGLPLGLMLAAGERELEVAERLTEQPT